MTLPANTQVLVPSGSTVTPPGGNVIQINGSDNKINTVAGSVVAVPAGATGPANNLVSTGAPSGCASAISATVTVLAGSASTNSHPVDGTGTSAVFWGGGHLAVAASGNIMVSDRGVLRQVTQAGVVTTLTQGGAGDFEGIALVGGTVYASGNDLNAGGWSASLIEYISGSVQPFVPNWEETSTNTIGPFLGLGGLQADGGGNLYYADGVNNRIVKFSPSGTWSAFAGSGASGSADGTGTAATLDDPTDLAIDPNGNIFFVDGPNNLVRKVSGNGVVTTIAFLGNGAFATAAIAVDSSGNVYFGGPEQVYRIAPNGDLASFSIPTSDFITAMTTDSKGNLYVGTRGSGAQIFKVTF